jgi:leader peptidase (prepilin peptidase)/N-methyltransferase
MTAVVVVVCALVGFAVGWCLDPVIVRVPRKLPVRGPVDGCTDALNDEPATLDALPVTPTVARVLLALLTGALFAGMGARFDDSWALPAYLVLAGSLVALSVIDLQHYLLPNRIVYPMTLALVALFTLAAALDDDWSALGRGAAAGGVAFAVYFVLHVVSPRSMGFGDVKLSFGLGLALGWLGWGELLLGLFLGFLYGAVIGILLMIVRHRNRKQAIPFGPFMAAGAITAILVGAPIITWYKGG